MNESRRAFIEKSFVYAALLGYTTCGGSIELASW
jgi:hypothetical protein